jgi:hypothetical protein
MTVEAPQTVVARVERALRYVPAENVILAPDCGMKYLPRDVALGKLKAMAEAARRLRAMYRGWERARVRERGENFHTRTCEQNTEPSACKAQEYLQQKSPRRTRKMTTANTLKSLLIAVLLSCASAHANEPARFDAQDGETSASFKLSDMQCQLIEAQVRCTFGGKRRG